MPDNETTNPYKANLDQLIDKFNEKFRYLIVSDQEKYPETITSKEVGDWNKNVDLYWKWEAGGNQPPVDPENPDPESDPYPIFPEDGGEDLPSDIVVSRNEVIELVRGIKRRFLELDRNQKIETATEPIDWDSWLEQEEEKYACLTDVENEILLLNSVVLTEENWIPCAEDIPNTPYRHVITSSRRGAIGMHYLDNNNTWKRLYTGNEEVEEEILAWMPCPSVYEEE